MVTPNKGFISWLKNQLIPWYTSLGLTSGTITIEVRGRVSGNPIRLAVTRVRRDNREYLVSLGANPTGYAMCAPRADMRY